jgi:hypothetical protein
MNTTELTGVGREGGRWWPRRLVVLLALFAAAASVIGVAQLRSTGGSPSPAQAVQISVAPGPTYPAALIHRIVAREEPPHPDRAPR